VLAGTGFLVTSTKTGYPMIAFEANIFERRFMLIIGTRQL
jgi:hypothetical protein